MQKFSGCLAVVVTLLAGCGNHDEVTPTAITYPQAATVDSADTYFGTRVADPYRWLENDTAAATRAWVHDEIATTDSFMAKMPFRGAIKKELTSLLNYARMTSPEK